MSALLLLLSPAFAQDGVDGHHFKPVPGYGTTLDLVETWRIEEQQKRSFGLTALVDASSGGLVQVTEDWTGTTESTLLDDVVAANLGLRGALSRRLALTAHAPLYVSSTGPDGPQPVGIGDIRLAAPIGLLLPSSGGLALGLVPTVDLPTGNASNMLGNSGLAVGGLVSAGWHRARFTTDANLGYQRLPEMSLDNLTGGGRLVASLGAGLSVTDAVGVAAELLYERGLAENTVPGTDSPVEALASLHGHQRLGFNWIFGVGAGLSEGAGAPAYRGFVGVGWAYIDDPNRDPDQDGVLGRDDNCPRDPEVKNDWKDADGCPDALADLALVVKDEEGTGLGEAAITIDGVRREPTHDGTVRLSGRMPDAALSVVADAAGYVQGTLNVAALDEGMNTRTLTLAWLPGTVRIIAHEQGGKPIAAKVSFKGSAELAPRTLDTAGRTQLVLPGGEWQVLVEAEGFGTEGRVVQIDAQKAAMTTLEFTLTPPKAIVEKKEVTITEAVLFDFNEATLRADSEPLLRQVAGQLLAHPELLKVEIQGHTDDVGDAAYNLDLSQRRVDAVMAWLIANGVSADRLVAKGYGETKPIQSNASEAGQAANRRVQFMILKKGE